MICVKQSEINSLYVIKSHILINEMWLMVNMLHDIAIAYQLASSPSYSFIYSVLLKNNNMSIFMIGRPIQRA